VTTLLGPGGHEPQVRRVPESQLAPMVLSFMTVDTECNQILHRIVAELAALIDVMHL
jgi:hypothetical protein